MPRKKDPDTLGFETNKFLKNWLEGKPKKTGETYRYAMKRYAAFTGLAPEEMLLEKQEDLKRPPMNQGVAENRMKKFFGWLKNKYVRKDGKKGLSETSAQTCVGALANFYKIHRLPLALNWKDFKANPKAENVTEKMGANKIRKMAYYAPTLRDKAIIWVMFQSGLDISTLLSLNWGHVEKEIEDPPEGALMLRNLVRSKEKTTFNSLIYKSAVAALRAYLKERAGPDYAKKLKYKNPLFLGRSGKRHDAIYVQRMLRELAPLTEIANSRFDEADMNPLRSHSLRASFSDQMAKAGASQTLIDYLVGHKVPFKGAYFGGEDGLRKAYVEYAEKALEPKTITSDEGQALQTTLDQLTERLAEKSRRLEDLETKFLKLKAEVENKVMVGELSLTPEEIIKVRALLARALQEK